MEFLTTLHPLWRHLLAAVLVIALVVVVLIGVLLLAHLFIKVRAALRPAPVVRPNEEPPEPSGEPEARKAAALSETRPPASLLALKQSFARAVKLLKTHVAGRSYRYQIPWFLMLGEAGSGKTTLLRNTGLSRPFGKPDEESLASGQGCNWWFFNEGIVLDIAGDYILRGDEASADERGRQFLLKLLKKYRPGRPIDGVVLTIPCTDLFGPPALSEERLTRARTKAILLYQRLWEIQKALGMSFPVYVLVTKCDQIQGFKSFCQAIPKRLHDTMLGWSNPYALETAYATDWVDEAFQSLHRDLYEAQLEVAAENADLRDRDGLFLFPMEFPSIREPLRNYLNHLFKQSVYHESFFLRGIYFCGDGDGTDSVAQRPGLVSESAQLFPEPPKPLFLKHLFEKKIFPEFGLALPASRAFVSMSRAALVAQVLLLLVMLVWGFGLWRSHDRLNQEKQNLLPILREIAGDLDALKDGKRVTQPQFDDFALDLLHGMTTLDASRLTTVFMPSSWFDPIHKKIVTANSLAFNKIILQSMLLGLNDKAEKLVSLGGEGAQLEADVRAGLAVEAIPEFVALRKYVEAIQELENNVNAYNESYQLGEDVDLAEELRKIGALVKYLYDVELPVGFYTQTGYYVEALATVSPQAFDPERYKPRALGNVQNLVQPLHGRLFQSNALLVTLQGLSTKLDKAARGSLGSDRSEEALRNLQEAIKNGQALLDQPGGGWITRDDWDLGPAFGRVLGTIEKSAFLGPELAAHIRESGEVGFQDLKKALGSQKTEWGGPLLDQKEGKIQLAFSKRVREVHQTLTEFFKLGFMAEVDTGEAILTDFSPKKRFIWDKRVLEEAIRQYEQYEPFLSKKLEPFPAGFRMTVEDASRNHLGKTIFNLTERALSTEPFSTGVPTEEDLRIQIKNFKETAPLLDRLLDLYDHAGLQRSYNYLLNLVNGQAQEMFKNEDSLLQGEALYQVKGGNFDWWNGKEPPAFAAFDMASEEGMKVYLNVQRERIQYLAREYAKPLVTVLTKERFYQRQRGQGRLLLSKWQGIIAEIDNYEKKKPGNSVAALETFILPGMNEINLDNCLEKLNPDEVEDRGGDFFLQKRNHLLRQVYSRCQRLAGKEVLGEYSQVEQFFNKNLAGKFPFSEVGVDGVELEAEPDAIRDFYHLFDRYGKTAQELLKRSRRFGLSGEHALEFLEEMQSVRGLFASFLENEAKLKEPVFDIGVEFRVNQKKEQGGNEVIDWNLAISEQTFRYRDDRARGRWTFGDPIRLTLRWAKDAPSQPVSAGDDHQARVKDNRAVYEFVGRWALIRFLEKYAASPEDFEGFVDPKPHTLKFLIKVRQREVPGVVRAAEAKEALVKIFVRVTVMAPENKEALVLPRFPIRAPRLSPATTNEDHA